MKAEGADPARIKELETQAKRIRERLRAEKGEDSHVDDGEHRDRGDDSDSKGGEGRAAQDDDHQGADGKGSGSDSHPRPHPRRR
jgi:hypothetical protein